MKPENPNSFVIFPRQLLRNLRDGSITRPEYMVYKHVRLCANPYGKAIVSFESLANEVFGDSKKTNYCNKLLLSLKSKRYVEYKGRSGRRGSFEVRLDFWPRGNNEIWLFEDSPFKPEVRASGVTESLVRAEEGQSLGAESQSQAAHDFTQTEPFSKLRDALPVRASYNDTETKKETDTETESSAPNRRFPSNIPVRDFEPQSHEEEQCLKIAEYLGEEKMDYLLSILGRYGGQFVASAWEGYRDAEEKEKVPQGKRAAYFNGIVKQMIKEREQGSHGGPF